MAQKQQQGERADEIYIKEELTYLVPLNIRSQIMKVLCEHFKVSERIVIEPKDISNQPPNSIPCENN